jgi:hypothetical protein
MCAAPDKAMSNDDISPKDEPELRRAKARRYAAWCNKHAQKPYVKIYIALELAGQAFAAHGLPYEFGLSNMAAYPPERFTWVCDETSEAGDCLKLRDNLTGRIVVWPHF